jgi:hypothetical protein
MALLFRNGWRRRWGAALQKSIRQRAELKQILERTDEAGILRLRRNGLREISPLGRDQRLTSVWQNQDKAKIALHDSVPKDFQTYSFERMMLASDCDTLRVVPKVGSLR